MASADGNKDTGVKHKGVYRLTGGRALMAFGKEPRLKCQWGRTMPVVMSKRACVRGVCMCCRCRDGGSVWADGSDEWGGGRWR